MSASFVVTLIDPWSANIIIDDAVIEQPRSKTAGPYNYRVSHISKVLQLLLAWWLEWKCNNNDWQIGLLKQANSVSVAAAPWRWVGHSG